MIPTPHDLISKDAVLALSDRAHSEHLTGLADANPLKERRTSVESMPALSRSLASRSRWTTQSRPQRRFAVIHGNTSQAWPVSVAGTMACSEFQNSCLCDAGRNSKQVIQTTPSLRSVESLSLSGFSAIRRLRFPQRECGMEVTCETVRHELRKTCHEKRDASQRPPAGGKPHCHSRGWGAGRTIR